MIMAGGVDFKNLLEDLECPICLSIFTDPKELSCNHVFCVSCLDETINFKDNGEGVIKCPLCNTETLINNEQTTNDLTISLYVKNIALKYNEKRLGNIVKCGTPTCANKNVIFCVDCRQALCGTCQKEHQDMHVAHKTSPICVSKDQSMQIKCMEHNKPCKYICCDDNELTCIYCVNREHRRHDFHLMKEQVQKIKACLLNEITRFESSPNLRTNVEKIIENSKQKFEKCILYRKKKAMHSYMNLLANEEERLRQEFENIVTQHINENDVAKSEDVFKQQLDRADIEIALLKKDIIDLIEQKGYPKLLPSRNVSLSELLFLSDHPLGNLSIYSQEIAVSDATESFSFTTTDTVEHELSSELLKKLGFLADVVQPNGAEVNLSDGQPVSATSNPLENADMQGAAAPVVVAKKDSLTSRSLFGSKKDITSAPTGNSRLKLRKSSSNTFSKDGKKSKDKDKDLFKGYKKCKTDLQKFEYVGDLMRHGRDDDVIKLLNENEDIFTLEEEGRTLMHESARHNMLSLVKLWIARGYDPYQFDNFGLSLMHFATRWNSVETLRYLCETFRDMLDMKKGYGYTAYQDALYYNYNASIRVLETFLSEEEIMMAKSTMSKDYWGRKII